ncbi:alpha/beta fold hydrolase [Sinirhodobacter populi]|uniref:Alpha/beta fold hydrolase n=1 Tax=Paenirhodobacter populi TaxID=2306993 RepID=A0A443K5I6_9RHOB|nr:alpha/beta fold hydrolase [Sinirhodobacter populi]RWR28041.1 alpha/beta fold hydrolase [Sinirhodobacter populi]
MIRVKGLPLGIRADMPGLPPLLLLHGLLSSRNGWLPNLAALRSRYRLILAELPGHGDAPPCTDPAQLHPDALVAALEEARQRLQIPRWHLCGLSFGAGITLRYALCHPHSVMAQVWTNGNRVLAPPPDAALLAQDEARCVRLAAEGVAALRAEGFHPRHGRRFPPALRDRLSAEADGCDIPTVIGLIRHCLPYLSLLDRFARTQVPVLLVNGRMEGRFQPVRNLAAGLLPAIAVTDLPGGHAINIEQPEAFDAAVLEFLARHDNSLG